MPLRRTHHPHPESSRTVSAADLFDHARHIMGWSTDEAAELTGISYRVVDYLTRCKIIRPQIHAGRRGESIGRRWSAQDIAALRAMHQLGIGTGENRGRAIPDWAPGVVAALQAHTIEQLTGRHLTITHDGRIGVLSEHELAEHLGGSRGVTTVFHLDQLLQGVA